MISTYYIIIDDFNIQASFTKNVYFSSHIGRVNRRLFYVPGKEVCMHEFSSYLVSKQCRIYWT